MSWREMIEMRILHLYADIGIEDEILSTVGEIVRVGIDPDPNPFSTVIQGDATDPPIAGSFDLAIAHPPCQRYSRATHGSGDPEDHPDHIRAARSVCQEFADHYIIENVPTAPLRDPVVFTGDMFGLPLSYPRAFETSYRAPTPSRGDRFDPESGPLSDQGSPGRAWVGETRSWRLAKGYAHDWPGRELKRHGIPAPYIRRLLYLWLSALNGSQRSEQTSLSQLQEGDD